MDGDIFKLTIPNKPDYISVARLTSSSIASKLDLSIDEIDDIKVSLSEACTNALRNSDEINILFRIYEDKLVIKVDNVVSLCEGDNTSNNEIKLGVLIMESLMDKVNFIEEGVELIKYIKDGIE